MTDLKGEVIVLDSGGYGPVTITKAVSITAPPGVYAGVSVFSGTGIVVNPGSGVVTLNGLTINSLGGTTGINYQSGNLRLNNVVVTGFSTAGLIGNIAASGAVTIRDSAFVDNTSVGLQLSTSSGTLLVTIERVRFENNTFALTLTDNVSGVIRDSTITGSGAAAGYIQALTAAAKTKMSLERCAIIGNNSGLLFGNAAGGATTVEITDSQFADNTFTGVYLQANGTVFFSNNKITRNGVGIDATTIGANAISFGDNQVNANGAGETFSSTILKK